jgi:uncharacterized protein involved in exopolysaccharide biosynthesis
MSDLERKIDDPSAKKDPDDEISLIDLFAVLWRRKIMIITIVVIAMVCVVAYSVLSLVLPPEKSPLPNRYAPEALMLINDRKSSGGGLSSMLSSSGLGGLASLAGFKLSSGQTYSQLAVYLVGTNTLLDMVVDRYDLINRYKIKKHPRTESRNNLKKQLIAEYDDESGVLSLSFFDRDPVFARDVVNFCAAYLEDRFEALGLDQNKIEKENLETSIANTYGEIQNLEKESHRLEQSVLRGNSPGTIPSITLDLNRIQLELQAQRQVYAQIKVQYELLKITMTSETPVFQMLEYAEVPDRKSGPSRGRICIIVTFAAGFFAVFLAFVLNAVENIKKDPEAMAKLKGVPVNEEQNSHE